MAISTLWIKILILLFPENAAWVVPDRECVGLQDVGVLVIDYKNQLVDGGPFLSWAFVGLFLMFLIPAGTSRSRGGRLCTQPGLLPVGQSTGIGGPREAERNAHVFVLARGSSQER